MNKNYIYIINYKYEKDILYYFDRYKFSDDDMNHIYDYLRFTSDFLTFFQKTTSYYYETLILDNNNDTQLNFEDFLNSNDVYFQSEEEAKLHLNGIFEIIKNQNYKSYILYNGFAERINKELELEKFSITKHSKQEFKDIMLLEDVIS